jgi:imidazole glycerol-phosphate synthase subunit HisH
MIAIIDYGMGNLHSVQKALESLGGRALVVRDPLKLPDCDKAVLPGVGAFDNAMQELKNHGLDKALEQHIQNKKPLLGICLGMQLFFTESQEAAREKGLGILKGSVRLFAERKGLKVPHMGWNQLQIKKTDCPLLRGIAEKSFVYFCHSYYPDPADKGIIAATTEYGTDFTSVLWKENIYGAQFHPEKSQETGLKMLKNFIELC